MADAFAIRSADRNGAIVDVSFFGGYKAHIGVCSSPWNVLQPTSTDVRLKVRDRSHGASAEKKLLHSEPCTNFYTCFSNRNFPLNTGQVLGV